MADRASNARARCRSRTRYKSDVGVSRDRGFPDLQWTKRETLSHSITRVTRSAFPLFYHISFSARISFLPDRRWAEDELNLLGRVSPVYIVLCKYQLIYTLVRCMMTMHLALSWCRIYERAEKEEERRKSESKNPQIRERERKTRAYGMEYSA